jgi:hypothetical protein
VARHIREKYGTTLELLMPIGGNPEGSRYQSLGEWETLSAKLLPGSVHDELWRTM